MKTGRIYAFFLTLILLAGAAAPAARGQDAAADKKAGEKGKKKGGGPIVLDEIVIEGRVQKPQAFYILQRSSFGYKIMDLEVKYTDAIVDSVKDEIF